MNQNKIGKFIVEKRKEQNLTQLELAEKLFMIIDLRLKKLCLMQIQSLEQCTVKMIRYLKYFICLICNAQFIQITVKQKLFANKKIKAL